MGIKDENKLINIIKRFETKKRRIIGSIGDDCAYLKEKEGKILAISVDAQVENVHFKREWLPPYYIGYRAMASCLSDLASKGAKPILAIVDMHITHKDDEEFIEDVYKGMYSLSKRFRFSIAGGNISHSNVFSLSITVIGELEGNIPERNKAKPGDFVYLTGDVGRSRLFLELVGREEIPEEVFAKFAMPSLRFNIMRDVTSKYRINASMDISDGLGIDAQRIAMESNVDIYIYEDRVPLHPMLKKYGRDVLFALESGEEYEVLFTTKDHIKRKHVSLIGEIKEGSGKVFLKRASLDLIDIGSLGFDHIKGDNLKHP